MCKAFYHLLLLIVITSTSYGQQEHSLNKENTPPNHDMPVKKDKNSPEDTLGVLINTIDCKVEAPEEKKIDFDNGIVPWVTLQSSDNLINLVNPDEIVLPFTKAILVVDFALYEPVFFELSAQGKGFTRRQLIREIRKKYHLVYEKEAKAERERLGKNASIWGDNLSHLALYSIKVYKNARGKIYLVPFIEG